MSHFNRRPHIRWHTEVEEAQGLAHVPGRARDGPGNWHMGQQQGQTWPPQPIGRTNRPQVQVGLCVRVMFSFSCCVVFLRLLSKSTLFFPYLLIYILHFLFICYIFFTITVTSNPYTRSVSGSWIWLGGFQTCPVSTYLQMKKKV